MLSSLESVVFTRLVPSSFLFPGDLADHFIFSCTLKMLRRSALYSISELQRGKRVLELLPWYRYWHNLGEAEVTDPRDNRPASLSTKWIECLEF